MSKILLVLFKFIFALEIILYSWLIFIPQTQRESSVESVKTNSMMTNIQSLDEISHYLKILGSKRSEHLEISPWWTDCVCCASSLSPFFCFLSALAFDLLTVLNLNSNMFMDCMWQSHVKESYGVHFEWSN